MQKPAYSLGPAAFHGLRLITALCAAALLASLAAGCGEEVPPETPVARPVKVLVFESGASGVTREYPGQVSAIKTAQMSFDIPGTIVEIPVQEGQRVGKGDLLARIDARDYKARADSEKSKMTLTRAELQRFEKLYSEQVVPRAQLDMKRTEFEVAEAAYREAEKALADTRLTAPFAGIVALKLADERENVQAKQPVVTLQGEGGMQVEVSVPESDFSLVRPGVSLEQRNARAKPRVILSAFPDREFPARLTELSTAADPVTRTFNATLVFEVPEDVTVLPGMTAKVVVDLPGDSERLGANRIPASAVLADDEGAAYVWRADPDTMQVHRAHVTVGGLSGSEIEILEGLDDGDLVAVSGVNSLREDMPVRRLED